MIHYADFEMPVVKHVSTDYVFRMMYEYSLKFPDAGPAIRVQPTDTGFLLTGDGGPMEFPEEIT